MDLEAHPMVGQEFYLEGRGSILLCGNIPLCRNSAFILFVPTEPLGSS